MNTGPKNSKNTISISSLIPETLTLDELRQIEPTTGVTYLTLMCFDLPRHFQTFWQFKDQLTVGDFIHEAYGAINGFKGLSPLSLICGCKDERYFLTFFQKFKDDLLFSQFTRLFFQNDHKDPYSPLSSLIHRKDTNTGFAKVIDHFIDKGSFEDFFAKPLGVKGAPSAFWLSATYLLLYKNPAPFLQIWHRFQKGIGIAQLFEVAEADKGKLSVFSILAIMASQRFEQIFLEVFEHIKDDKEFTLDRLLSPKLDGQIILNILLDTLVNERYLSFLKVLHHFKDQWRVEHFTTPTSLPSLGNAQFVTRLDVLTCFVMENLPEPFLMVWDKFKDEFEHDHIINGKVQKPSVLQNLAQAEINTSLGIFKIVFEKFRKNIKKMHLLFKTPRKPSVLFYLALASRTGNVESFVLAFDHVKETLTLDDLLQESTVDEYKGMSILSEIACCHGNPQLNGFWDWLENKLVALPPPHIDRLVKMLTKFDVNVRARLLKRLIDEKMRIQVLQSFLKAKDNVLKLILLEFLANDEDQSHLFLDAIRIFPSHTAGMAFRHYFTKHDQMGSVEEEQDQKTKKLSETLISMIESPNSDVQAAATQKLSQLIEQNQGLPKNIHVGNWSPLSSAIIMKNERLIDVILENPIDFSKPASLRFCSLYLAGYYRNFPLIKRILEKIRLQDVGLFNETVQFLMRGHEYSMLLAEINIVDIATFDSERQFHWRPILQEVPLSAGTLNFLIRHSLTLLSEMKLARLHFHKKQIPSITVENDGGYDQAKINAIRGLCARHAWLDELLIIPPSPRLEAKGGATISIGEFYDFLNDLEREFRQLSKGEKACDPIISSSPSLIPANVVASSPMSLTNPAVPSTRRDPVYLPSFSHPAKKTQTPPKASSLTTKPNTGKTKNQSRVKAKKPPVTPSLNPRETKKEKSVIEIPLPKPGPFEKLVVAEGKEPQYPEFVSKEERKAKKHLARLPANQPLVKRARELLSDRNAKINDLSAVLGHGGDKGVANYIFDLALFDIISKLNRDFREIKEVYKFDCDMIHGCHHTMRYIEGSNLEFSPIALFAKSCFVDKEFNIHDSFHRGLQAFAQNSKKGAAAQECAEISAFRLSVIKMLVEFLPRLYSLLETPGLSIVINHAMSASMIILGEQFARLSAFSEHVDTQSIKDSPLGIILNRYRKYRNLRHGPDKQLKTGLFPDQDESIAFTLHGDEEWEDKFPKLLHKLMTADLAVLTDPYSLLPINTAMAMAEKEEKKRKETGEDVAEGSIEEITEKIKKLSV